jgi:hypothetical protein
LQHISDNGEIGLDELPAFIQLLEAAFGDSNRVATTEYMMHGVQKLNPAFCHYYARFQVITADRNWNPFTLQSAHCILLFEKMMDSLTYSDIREDLSSFVMVHQKHDNHIQQQQVEKAVQNKKER